MFDYFKNYSSNADHQVCCEDGPTKCLYDHCQSDNLDLHSRSLVHLKLDYFLRDFLIIASLKNIYIYLHFLKNVKAVATRETISG